MADFVGMHIAGIVVTASILLAGILIGAGRAFGYKKIENFGIEELIQSIINGAIIGAFAVIIGFVSSVSESLVQNKCGVGDAVQQLSCSILSLESSVFSLFQGVVKTLNLIGYYQGLSLDFGSFSIAPFSNLSSLSSVLSFNTLLLQLLIILLNLNVQILSFISSSALLLLLPVGLVLRTFFATRKVGGFLIALSIGLYLFYPVFILIFPDPTPTVTIATNSLVAFNNNNYYATIPVVDLNNNYAIAGKLDVMGGRCNGNISNASLCQNLTLSLPANSTADFSGDLTLLSQQTGHSVSSVILYAVIAPLFSLLVTIVFVKELTSLLGGELSLSAISNI